ncbi:MAG: heme A synthase [Rickettsiales bacterium]|nr:MAG: heme A synthase [Rickettsiales bacterium]
MRQLYNRQNSALSLWLLAMCLAVIVMIFIGGLTRLTESGLSITEWNPVSGALPPQNGAEWGQEFEKYKKSPEYLQHNMGMSISEFKSIYMLEFVHRLAGRFTGLLYLLPLMIFWLMGSINKRDSGTYLFILFLLALQGAMGWYMVKSGLVADPCVCHYRLAAHLMLAVFMYILLFWQLMRNSFDILLIPGLAPGGVPGEALGVVSLCRQKFWCTLSIFLLLIQIMLGAFVAGLDAGLVYNSFPLMGEGVIPHEVSLSSVNLASFSEPVFIQFIHRMMAYMLFFVVCIFCFVGARLRHPKFTRSIVCVFAALSLQMIAGVVTLLYSVPIPVALLHQLGAIILLSFLLWAYFLLKSTESE